MGEIKKGGENKIKLRFNDINSKTFQMEVTCGCLTHDQRIIDEKTKEVTVGYNRCSGAFAKTFIITEGNNRYELKLQGTCNT